MEATGKRILPLVAVALLCCAVMTLVDGVIRPGYAVKSAVKVALFLLLPLLLARFDGELEFRALFRFRRRGWCCRCHLTGQDLGRCQCSPALGKPPG